MVKGEVKMADMKVVILSTYEECIVLCFQPYFPRLSFTNAVVHKRTGERCFSRCGCSYQRIQFRNDICITTGKQIGNIYCDLYCKHVQ